MSGNVEDIYELSPLQQGMLLHSLHDGAADMYLSQHTYAVEGPLDVDALVSAWEAVVAAHPVLRSSFHWKGLDKPLQVAHRDVALPVHRHDWSGLDEERQRERLGRLQTEDRAAGFDPAAPPLQRLHVLRLGDRRHTLIWTYHHVLLDGWSIPVVLDEVMAWYRTLTLGAPPPRPVAAYRDYIAWLQRQDLQEARDLWTKALAGVRPSLVSRIAPADPGHGTGAVERRTVALPETLTEGLRDAAARHRVTLSTMVQAVWAVVVQSYTGQPEITFGCATSGRPPELPQVERMVGLFANTLPLRVTVPDDGDLGAWLRDIQNTYAGMRRYEYAPLADIKKWAEAPGQQLFDTLLVLENYSLAIDSGTGDAAADESLRFGVDTLYDKIDLPLTLTVAPSPVSEMQLLIHRDRFAPGFVDDLLKRLHLTMEAIIAAGRVAPVVSATGPRPVLPSEPVAAMRQRPAAPEPPATPEEEAIAAVYKEILSLADVDVTASFFELGGDSFDAVRAVGRIDGAGIATLASHPSVRELARALSSAEAEEPEAVLDDEIAELERLLAAKRAAKERQDKPGRMVPVARDRALPCTQQQEGLWFMHRLDPASPTYHIPFALRLRGALDVASLERALLALVVRHEALRTRFVEEDGLPRQVIDPPPPAFSLPVTGLDGGTLERWAADEAHRPFDLAAGPLFRAALARLGPEEHAIVLVVHHIVADGWSAKILAEELGTLYAAERGAGGIELPEVYLQPGDHAVWQRGLLDGAEMDRQMAYWRGALAGLPTLDFPADRPRPARPTGAGAVAIREMPAGTAAAARAYARTHRVSFLAVLQAALLTVLHRYTGQDDLVIGSIFSGRTRPEIEPVVGFFANTVVLRTDLGGEPTFSEVVGRCNETVLNATERQEIPFALIVDALQPERVAGRNPLFQISLSLQPAGTQAGLALGDVRAEPIEVTDDYARFDILINVADAGGRSELMVEYSTELFDADRIERLLDHYVAALTNGLAEPGAVTADIGIMPVTEHHQVLQAWNDTAGGPPVELVHQMVERTVARTPEAVAVLDHDGTEWTYAQLDLAANRLAHRLRRYGVGPGVPVGVCLYRGADMVIALLAALKAGGGYLPFEPDLPPERLAFMLADAAPPVVVTHAAHASAFPVALTLDTERDALATEPADPPDSGVTVDSLAYVLYTSGSTGTPKGVLVAHRGVHKQLAWMQETYGLEPADRVLQKTPYSFDVSVWEFFWPLAAGATIVVAAPGGHRDPEYLHRLIAREGITTMHFVPSMLLAFLDAVQDGLDPGALHGLRLVFASGEALPPVAARRFLAIWPGIELHNLYGPTEASIDVTSWRCEPDAATVPIGPPITNMRTYILDGRLRPVPIGVPGQLFIGGPVALGYVNRPGLTAERFLADPYADRPGERMYASGDLTRWRRDGVIEYLGRTDRQVKLRGQRIELGEIEHVLARHPAVRHCAVLLRDDSYLAAYVVAEPGHDDPDPAELNEYLAHRLPAYMIPTAWVALPDLPVTRNGKLDIAALPAATSPAAEYVAPRTATERWLAAAWQGLLGVERVGVHDDFFDLGGNSLHGTQLIARIRNGLSVELELRHLFTSRVLEQLAARLDETGITRSGKPIAPVAGQGPLPCTLQQDGLWFMHRLDPASPTYHIPYALALRGALDVASLEWALLALAGRHEGLRTRFVEEKGLPRQVIDPPPAAFSLPVTEMAAADVARWAEEQICRPFDLAAGPLFRTALARLAPDHHVLVLVVHHIVADGWSGKILAGELAALYTGDHAALPELRVRPVDHAVWQRGWLDGAEMDRQMAYWRAALAGLPTLDFPADRPRPARPTGAGAVAVRAVPAGTAAAARGYARTHQVSFLAVLQAALLTVLHRYTGQDDLVIGSIFSGRTRPEIEPVVGFFANTVVLRTDLGGEPTFAEVVGRCHETVLNASERQDIPFALIVDALQPERVAGRNPLFQISLTLQPASTQAGLTLGTVTTEPVELTGGYARFDIAFDVIDNKESLDLVVEYSTELFDADRMERLLDHYVAALANGLADPGAVAEDVDIMSSSERHQVLHAWNPAGAVAVIGPGKEGE
ncbi:amino acid adenylation domain-containing protein [Sphaerisporangium aureirubrum]|uniref:Amino acid adenylation domain-containing protein n=1 Tax=Sphaerisporangium aureirubrum TaxID=1544736 RepID=A0ABW1NKC8_9ACTN